MNDFLSFLAPAKINLFLHITGRRSDGYHTLQSVFLLLDYYDTIYLKPTITATIKRIGQNNGVPESQDLCTLAAYALKQATGCTKGVEFKVDKRIPIGGGLGGGSSDAATVLLALNKIWQLNLSRETLMQIGLTLGADVPMFIFGQTAWAEGVGEILQVVELPKSEQDQYYVVLTPHVQVFTAQIFAKTALTRDTKPLKMADFSRSKNYFKNTSIFKNDLEKAACIEYPAVAATLNLLKPFGNARMSGSGASVFIAVDSLFKANELIAAKPANISGFIAKGLNKHPHYDLST